MLCLCPFNSMNFILFNKVNGWEKMNKELFYAIEYMICSYGVS